MRPGLFLVAAVLALCLGAGLLAAQEMNEPAPLPADASLSEPAARPTKDARAAMTASVLFPGLGQLYNEEGLKTLLVFAWESYYIALILREGQQADFYRRRAAALAPGETWRGLEYEDLRKRFHAHQDREVDTIWYGSALLIASVLDAYVFANLYGHETGDVRRPRAGIRPLLDPAVGSVGLRLSWDF